MWWNAEPKLFPIAPVRPGSRKRERYPSHNNLHLNVMKTRSVVKTRWPLAMYVLYV